MDPARGKRLYSPDAHCFCPLCSWLIDAPHLKTKKLRSEELPLIARDAKLAPNLAILQYRYGLALYTDGQWDLALEQLKKAVELEPKNQDYQSILMQLQQKIDERDSQPTE